MLGNYYNNYREKKFTIFAAKNIGFTSTLKVFLLLHIPFSKNHGYNYYNNYNYNNNYRTKKFTFFAAKANSFVICILSYLN